MTSAYDDEAIKPLGPRPEPPRPPWVWWFVLAALAASAGIVPAPVWLLR